jgi:Ca2+-binding EF-hand superfamily protein
VEVADALREELGVRGAGGHPKWMDLQRMFKKADVDGSGLLSRREFAQLLLKADVPLTEAGLEAVMDALDANGDGFLSFEEFMSVFEDAGAGRSTGGARGRTSPSKGHHRARRSGASPRHPGLGDASRRGGAAFEGELWWASDRRLVALAEALRDALLTREAPVGGRPGAPRWHALRRWLRAADKSHTGFVTRATLNGLLARLAVPKLSGRAARAKILDALELGAPAAGGSAAARIDAAAFLAVFDDVAWRRGIGGGGIDGEGEDEFASDGFGDDDDRNFFEDDARGRGGRGARGARGGRGGKSRFADGDGFDFGDEELGDDECDEYGPGATSRLSSSAAAFAKTSPLERARARIMAVVGGRSAEELRRFFARAAKASASLGASASGGGGTSGHELTSRAFRSALKKLGAEAEAKGTIEPGGGSGGSSGDGFPLDEAENAALLARFSAVSGEGVRTIAVPSLVEFLFGRKGGGKGRGGSGRGGGMSATQRKKAWGREPPDSGSDISVSLERIRGCLEALNGNSTSSSSSSRGGGRRAAKPVDLAALFKAADADGDGHLSPADFEAALASLGEPLSRTELAAVMRYFDADRSGRVSYIEFLAGVFDWQRLRAAARRSAEALRAR